MSKNPEPIEPTLHKHCDPAAYEAKWTEYWDSTGAFSQHPREGAPFTIVIPPPNVTGSLHMGHALNTTLQDVLVRFNHLRGRDSLWVPGMDHAGIATQNVVEKQLRAEGLSRHDLGREKFVERVWCWKHETHDNIANQFKRMGLAIDWTRERFTMDERCSRAVRHAFKQLFEEGLIYQGHRMINWCPRCKTALSDIEVESNEIDGAFYHLKYPVEGTDEFLEIATTRPETMLADTAVAVHPDDERYAHLHGKFCILPLVGRRIPIITDTYVDMEFGTGALKVTPAHDPNDFELGKTHNLEAPVMMDEDGRITADYPAYAGMDRHDARRKIVEDLTASGILIKTVPHRHAVGHCYRCGVIVEPYISLQWFVNMKELAAPALQAVRDGRTQFVPDRWAKVYADWLENIRDWCISRQLWWGHRIPVWDCPDCGTRTCPLEDITTCPKCGSANIIQQEDVLDTWFSSGLWPLSTLGWPDESHPDYQKFYPTSVLVTAFDIIFFWVARMMFFGLKFSGDIPFRHVFIHGIVRDEKGKKMSKSFGNVINPLELIDKYGADALRFTFLYSGSMGQDVSISDDKVKTGRNFCNKLWNAARYILMTAGDAPSATLDSIDPALLDTKDRWILTRAADTIAECATLIDSFDLNEAIQKLYSFFWHDFCDWYLELSKSTLYGPDGPAKDAQKTLLHCILQWILSMLHPFMPFITEEIWDKLPHTSASILDTPWPTPSFQRDEAAVAEVDLLQEATRAIRELRANIGLPATQRIDIVLSGDPAKAAILKNDAAFLSSLAFVNVAETLPEGCRSMSAYAGGAEILLPFETAALEEELARLRKKESENIAEIERIEKKLSNESFVARAPETIVNKEKEKMDEYRAALDTIRRRIEVLTA